MGKKHKISPITKPRQRNGQTEIGDCFNCGNCQYHSEGDHYCEVDFSFVLADWVCTDDFMWCNGKHWIKK